MHLHSVFIAGFLSWLLFLLNDSTEAMATGISLEGCFKNLSNYMTRRNLSDKNGPRQCFDECNNTEYIGLQKQDCFCNGTMGAYATERDCNFACPGDRKFSCGSDIAIYVYHKVQTNISVYGEFGFVYLHVLKQDGHNRYGIYGTNDITEKRRYICYDEPSKCDFKAVGTAMTWQEAKDDCLLHNKGLVPYRIAIDELICTSELPGGYFWIGMSWFNPAATTTPTTAASTLYSSTKTTLRSKPTTDWRPNYNSTTPVMEETSKASSSNGISVIAVAVPVSICAVVSVVLVITCWCLQCCCFKSCRKGVQTGEINNASLPEIPDMNPLTAVNASPSVAPGSTRVTFHGHPENIRPIISGQTNIHGGQYARPKAENSDKDTCKIIPNHLELSSLKPVTSDIELDEGLQSALSEREKGKGKRKKKNKKENHRIREAKENGQIDGSTDNHADLGRYTNGDLSVLNERTENPNDERRDNDEKTKEKKKKHRDYSYLNKEKTSTTTKLLAALDPKIHSDRPATASDIYAIVPTAQEKRTDSILQSDKVHTDLNDNSSDGRKEKTKKRKRSGKRSKRKGTTLFDLPAEHPVVEGQTDINNKESPKK